MPTAPALAHVLRGDTLWQRMESSEFAQLPFFRAIDQSGARALLIGRQALIVLGLPVMTADYDFWLHFDDISLFNHAAERFGLVPNRTESDARQRGRYVLENDERVDVLIVRSHPAIDGTVLAFDEAWERRQRVDLGDDVGVFLPSIDDLIVTKRFAARPRDAEDIRLLEVLRSKIWPR